MNNYEMLILLCRTKSNTTKLLPSCGIKPLTFNLQATMILSTLQELMKNDSSAH